MTRTARWGAGLAVALGLWVSAPASAQVQPQPEVSLSYENVFAARVNPLGLVDIARFSLRIRLYESDSPILTQNYIGFGIVPAVSAAWGRVGALVEVQPLSILRLYARYDFMGYFSTFNLFSSFESANSEFSDTVVRDRTEIAGMENYATYGGILTAGATLQIALGPFAARNLFRAIYSSYDVRDGDRVFYDPILDVLMPNDSWIAINEVDALGLFDVDDFSFALGLRWSYVHAFYDDGHYAPGEDPSDPPDNDIHRLGPIFAWTLMRDPGAMFDQPQIIVLAQWHLVHRYRTGADVNIGVPYLGLAFKFQGDLLADH
ncbi:MAG: hypothetical protein AB8I08_36775 [Sandaracinaceae bacterium]